MGPLRLVHPTRLSVGWAKGSAPTEPLSNTAPTMAKTVWYLVQGQFTFAQAQTLSGFVHLADGQALPILPSGRVHEIVPLVDPGMISSPLQARRLGWFERTWRMAWRVLVIRARLTRAQRWRCGLTWRRIIISLPEAYRIASRFRGMTYTQWVAEAEPQIRAAFRSSRPLAMPAPRIVVLRCEPGAQPPQLNDSDWLMLLAPDDRLTETALTWFAHEAARHPSAGLIYADDDEIDAQGRRLRPRFKPDWSYLHLQEIDYIGSAAIISARALNAAGGLKAENLAGDTWELLLRIGRLPDIQVRHIPAVLLHRAAPATDPPRRRVRMPLPDVRPWVSIIVPTRDAPELLERCVESVLAKTAYPHYEMLVVDNQSRDADALRYLQALAVHPQVRVLHYDRPFNFSAINNFAVRHAQGEAICLLNNDTEVITPDWLDEMVGHLTQPKVGVVGARLLFPDGRVQHAGDTVGPGGCANHLHEGIAADAPGYCQRALVAQDLCAVTAACMLTWRNLYLHLGGMNERFLPVAFNDVDYCLRVRQAGLRVVYTPHAELYHHESASRSRMRGWRKEFRAWREVRYMRWRWREEMRHDPYYNPNFSYLRADFMLGP